VRALRESVLAGICGRLARLPRIHAALEDDALDLLYPSARNELRFLIDGQVSSGGAEVPIQAVFYRFLDAGGHVIPTQGDDAAGDLPTGIEAALALPGVPDTREHGFFIVPGEAGDAEAVEVFAAPIVSTVTWRPIATPRRGFPGTAPARRRPGHWHLDRRRTGDGRRGRGHPRPPRGLARHKRTARFHARPRTLDIRGVPHRRGYTRPELRLPLPSGPRGLPVVPGIPGRTADRSLRQILRMGAVLLPHRRVLSYPLARRLARPVHALARGIGRRTHPAAADRGTPQLRDTRARPGCALFGGCIAPAQDPVSVMRGRP
jgi:hypothetical protein